MIKMQNLLGKIFGIGVLPVMFVVCNINTYTNTGGLGAEVFAAQNQETPISLIKKDDDVVIYKNDIIVRSDELKKEFKKEVDKNKPAEKSVSQKQEISTLDTVNKDLKEGKKIRSKKYTVGFIYQRKYARKTKGDKGPTGQAERRNYLLANTFP